VLAGAVAFQSIYALTTRNHAEESPLGLAVLATSLVTMPVLSFAKLWVAARAQMPVLAAEAKETIACAYLTLTALAGVVAIFLFGWWWLDAVAALLMIPWLVKEGREGLRGENCVEGGRPCFCRRCLFGLRGCRAACCTPAFA
jgi:divalent metal cation (Fe/Co/Zn/Cd) transporter